MSIPSKHEQTEVDLQESCSKYEDIGSHDLAPLISCHITPIVTVPIEDEDESDDGSVPGLETDRSSSDEVQAGSLC